MRQRQRKLVGTVLLLVLLTVYAFAVTTLAIGILPRAGKLVEALFYAVAGLLWTLPAAALIWWMQKPDQPRDG